jgi:hypothetical protein
MMQFANQSARDISSQDMNQWLTHALGISNNYGQGEQNLMNQGANSANMISQLFQNMGTNMGQGAAAEQAGKNQDRSNILGGGLRFLFGG